MPSLSYSELVGLLIAGALVLYPLTQTELEAGPASAPPTATSASSTGVGNAAAFVCPRQPGP